MCCVWEKVQVADRFRGRGHESQYPQNKRARYASCINKVQDFTSESFACIECRQRGVGLVRGARCRWNSNRHNQAMGRQSGKRHQTYSKCFTISYSDFDWPFIRNQVAGFSSFWRLFCFVNKRMCKSLGYPS